mgnify:CR=1 FL=1
MTVAPQYGPEIGEIFLFDLAVLDIMLPDIDGFILCQKIREKHTYPIIMLTAKDGEMDKPLFSKRMCRIENSVGVSAIGVPDTMHLCAFMSISKWLIWKPTLGKDNCFNQRVLSRL